MNFAQNLQTNNFFRGFSLGQQQSEAPVAKLEDLINRSYGLGKNEKNVIFNYVRTGEETAKSRKEYITNIIIIFNSFFEYGFLRRSNNSSSGGGGKSSYTDEWAESGDSSHLAKVEHYWEYMTMQFHDLDSVKYINFYYEDATTNREKALGWILLALNQKEELKTVVLELFSNIPILQLYSKEESYLWTNRKEILESVEAIATKNMYNPCPLLDNFLEYNRKKNDKKEKQTMLKLLDNQDNINEEEDEDEQLKIQPPAAKVQGENYRTVQRDRLQSMGNPKREMPLTAVNQQEDEMSSRFGKISIIEQEDKAYSSVPSKRNNTVVSNYKERNSNSSLHKKNSFSIDSQSQKNAPQAQVPFEVQVSMNSSREQRENSRRSNLYEGVSSLDKITPTNFIANKRLNLFSPNEILAQQTPNEFGPRGGLREHYLHAMTNESNDRFWMENTQREISSQQFDNTQLTQGNISQRFFYQEDSRKSKKKQRDSSVTENSQQSLSPFKSRGQRQEPISMDKRLNSSSFHHNYEENQQSLGQDESRVMIDRIFNEGDILIPLHARKEYKMIFQDYFGKEYYQELYNSDMVYFNEFYELLKVKEYNYSKKHQFMRKKEQVRQHSKNVNGFCGSCFKNFKKTFGLFDQKQYCCFCLDYTCYNCIANQKVFVPTEFQLKFTVGKEIVCKDAQEFLSNFEYKDFGKIGIFNQIGLEKKSAQVI